MAKTFFVIGAGPGIGMETARRFAGEGFEIVLASRDPSKLTEQIRDLTSSGATVRTEAVDATDGAAVTSLIESYAKEIDVLLYNAAAVRFGPSIDELTNESLNADIDLDLTSALRAIKAVLPAMIARGSGSILLTGGGIADHPHPQALTLSAGKAGLRAAGQALFEDLKARNVHIATLTVNAQVTPDSPTAREIADAFWALHASPAAQWVYEQKYP